jgi:flagellar biosynthesis protein FliR
MMFQSKHAPLLCFDKFLLRSLRFILYSLLRLAISLGIGVSGYMYFCDLHFVDAFYNASMILTGMGPVDPMNTTSSKWFASFYALFSGMAFLTTMAVLFAPATHRFLHKIHVSN